jgi:hypothetical protein
MRLRSVLAGFAVTMAFLVCGAAGSAVPVTGVEPASAVNIGFCNGLIEPGGRCVGPYAYLYGVGWGTVYWQTSGNNVCLGAKTNADGSGGNALPFTCLHVGADQYRWTPGGSSNWGYPTIINQESWQAYGSGVANIRP